MLWVSAEIVLGAMHNVVVVIVVVYISHCYNGSRVCSQGFCVCIDLVNSMSSSDLLQKLKQKVIRSPEISRALGIVRVMYLCMYHALSFTN